MMDFPSFARAHGVLIRDLHPDGRIHRCPTVEHPRARNGAYRYTGDWGWVQAWDVHAEPIVWRDERAAQDAPRIDRSAAIRGERERALRAARRAAEVVQRARYDVHPYLAAKGFAAEQALIDTDGRMVVPMRSLRGQINSVQWIAADGTKKFLPGGVAKGSIFAIGAGTEQWLCEGFVDGLTLRAALKRLYRSARVVVCFSAGNLAYVAPLLKGPRLIYADNDVGSQTGERAAKSTGLPWVMSDTPGHDVNDDMRVHGLDYVVEKIRSLLRVASA